MKHLNVAFVGIGDRGYFADFWADNQHVNITAVSDINRERMQEFTNRIGKKIYTTTNYKDLLSRDDVDAIVLMTPDYLHYEQSINILQADKHIFLEKPMALKKQECEEIISECEKSNAKLMIGFNMRHMNMYMKMKDIIDSGEIGEVKAIWVRHFVGYGGYFFFQDWHRNKKYTDSLLIQKGSHDFDVIHMLADSYTKKVSALGSLDFYNDEDNFNNDGLVNKISEAIDVEDNYTVIMELENGVKAAYLQCHFTPDYSRNYTIIGTKGRIENDDINGTINILNRNQADHVKSKIINMGDENHAIGHIEADKSIINSFVNYVLFDEEPNASMIDALKSVEVGENATKSLRNGGELIWS